MPGSGINRSNIVNFQSFNEIHGSFKNEILDGRKINK